MKRSPFAWLAWLIVTLTLLAACTSQRSDSPPAPASARNAETRQQAFSTGVIAVPFGPGAGSCSICGSATSDYSCAAFPDWSSGTRSFTDTSPTTQAVVTSVSITVYGQACSSSDIDVKLNGTVVGTWPSAMVCSCGTCDAPATITLVDAAGVPGYVVGGSNDIQIASTSGTCVQRVEVTASGPALASVAPTTGGGNGGTSVVIAGTDLPNTTPTVTFGGAAATVTSATSSAIDVKTPAHAAGPVDVVVTYPGGTQITIANGYTYVAPTPTATTLTILSTPAVFGQSVTLSAHVSGAGVSGKVQFYDGGVALGAPVALNGAGDASRVGTFSIGTHAITAQYSGSPDFDASAAAAKSLVVGKASTTTTLASSGNPATVGGNVTFTATVGPVAPGAGTPGGNVVFTIDGVDSSPTPLVNGVGKISTSSLAVGAHDVTATYAGDPDFAGSSSTTLNENVAQDGDTVALGSSNNPSSVGDSVTFTAIVTTASTGGTPTGLVHFFDGATEIGAANLASGVASMATSSLTGGSHSITAQYEGDAKHASAASATVTQTVKRAPTAMGLVASTSLPVFGQTVTITANVSSGVPVPVTGTVTFFAGVDAIGSASVANGTAAITTSSLPIGTTSITSQYSGDLNFFASSASGLSIDVSPAKTTTTLSSSQNPAPRGALVTFTATVGANAPSQGIVPTGSVKFSDNGNVLATVALSAGVATFSTSSLAVGTHAILAAYQGASTTQPSTSATVDQRIDPTAPVGSVTAQPNPATFGTPVALNAAFAGDAGTPTGTVTFFEAFVDDAGADAGIVVLDGGTQLLNDGGASLSYGGLGAGVHTLGAHYDGDSVYGRTTVSVQEVVTRAATSVTLSASGSTALVGKNIPLSAAITSAAMPVSGSADFFDGNVLLGTAPVTASGIAVYVASFDTLGSHALSVVYGGDPNHESSTSSVFALDVQADIDGGTSTDASLPGDDAGAGVDAAPSIGKDASIPPSVTIDNGAAPLDVPPSSGCGCRTVAGVDAADDEWLALPFAAALVLAMRRTRRRDRDRA